MMRIEILTAVPGLFKGIFSESIMKRAIDKKLVYINIYNLHNYGLGKHKKIDDYSYGGGPGMVLRIEPIYNCLTDICSKRDYDEIIFMTSDGTAFLQSDANSLSKKNNLIIICGHYKGIDQRIRDNLITKEFSIGNYVISGGELAAAVIIDAIVRMIPGVLGNYASALTDSFQSRLIEPPIYTRPSIYKGWEVPKILLSGNFKKIEEWREQESLKRIKNKIFKNENNHIS